MKFLTDDVTTILKWVITILITGFIAQFGKKFANYIIEKTSERKLKRQQGTVNSNQITEGGENSSAPASPAMEEKSVQQPSTEDEKERLKAEKKIQKERTKQIKKMAKAEEKAEKKQDEE